MPTGRVVQREAQPVTHEAYQASMSALRSLQTQYSDLKSDYDTAKENRFYRTPSGIATQGSGPDYHYRTETAYFRTIELARNIRRNDKVVGQGIRTLVRNVIQDGFTLEAGTPDETINDELQDRWLNWTEDREACDYQGENDWHSFEKLLAEGLVVDGDNSLSPLRTGQLQAFEAHRMRTPTDAKRELDIKHGVERDSNGRRRRYWITKQDYDGFGRVSAAQRELQSYLARQYDEITQRNEPTFYHLYFPSRLNQTRGVSPLVPVTILSGMLDDVTFAKLVQQQIVSYFAILRNIPLDAEMPILKGDRETDPNFPNQERETVPLAPGAEYTSQVPGELITGFSPNVPNPEFFQQSKILLSFIACNLDLPLMLLLMDASETNFSGWRGAFDQAKLKFRDFQLCLANILHKPVYRWKVRQWMSQSVELRRAYQVMGERMFTHEWHFPRWPYIQPLDDTSADLMQVRNALNSPRRVAMAKNLAYEDIATETVADNELIIRLAIQAAKRLNAEDPTARVDWREVHHPAPSENIQIALQPGQAGQSNQSGQPATAGAATNAN